MVYNGQSIYRWMIWGYPYDFGNHHIPLQLTTMTFSPCTKEFLIFSIQRFLDASRFQERNSATRIMACFPWIFLYVSQDFLMKNRPFFVGHSWRKPPPQTAAFAEQLQLFGVLQRFDPGGTGFQARHLRRKRAQAGKVRS